jgi:hypothetical protein
MISCAQTHVAHLFSCHEYVLARTPAIMDRKAEPLSFGSDHCTSLLHFTCDFVFEGKKFVLGRVALAARPAWPSRLEEEEEEEEEEDLFVFNDTIEGPRAPAVKPGRVTQA